MHIFSFIQKNILPLVRNNFLWRFFQKTALYHKVLAFYLDRISYEQHIYPIALPEVRFQEGLDLLLLEMPSRYQPMVPNGMGALEMILEKTSAKFQIFDFNILLYHRFHSERFLHQKKLVLNGKRINDPWETDSSFYWKDPQVIHFFHDSFEELLTEIERVKPRMIGFSVHENNRLVCNYMTGEIRKRLPETKILAGGYDCYHPLIGRAMFPDFDYMFIGEAEMNLGLFMERYLAGQTVEDIPGLLFRDPAADAAFQRVDLLHDLDSINYPQYHFCKDFTLYRDYNGNSMLFPVSGSRGCVWSRCNFCGECIKFRYRDPEKVFQEILSFYHKGFRVFHFNESDCNGRPENLYRVCEKIIESKIKISLIGQLRIHPHCDLAYFQKLRQAGFVHLRFGVDGFCDDILKLESKGYNMKMVEANLKACREAGLRVAINIVIGVPGETDAMIEESCANIDRLHPYIDIVESLNTLILNAGSKYFSNPELFNIKFRGDREEIYRKYPLVIPTDLWYSDSPYIDQPIRIRRMEKIIQQLTRYHIDIGSFAKKMVKIHKGQNELDA